MWRQFPAARMSWPSAGASTGMTMKTIITIDMVCAIAEPWKRSRMTATTSTRVPAAAAPCRVRAASNRPKLVAIPASAPNKANRIMLPTSSPLRPNLSASGP